MTKLFIELSVSLQIVIFFLSCCRESISFKIGGNHRIIPCGTGRSINRNQSIYPANPVRDFRFRASSLGFENDSEEQKESAQNQAAWSTIINPSSSAISFEHTGVTTTDKLTIAILAASTVNMLLMIIVKSPGSWRFFLAGGLCAAISHAIPTPVDVVKTRKQVDPRLVDHSFLEAGRQIVKEEGFNALLAGLGPTTWGYLMEGAIKFGVYEVLKPILNHSLSRIAAMSSILTFLDSQFIAFFFSGIFSGLAASFVLCPMEVIRIRMVAEPNYSSGGWMQGGLKILRQEGVDGFTKGLNPMILKQVPYTVTKNVSFDLFTKFFYSTLRQSGLATASCAMKFTIPLVSAAIASVLSSLTSQPGDTILSLSCAHDGDYKTRDIARNILHSDRGISGFYVGAKTRLLHVGIIVTLQLLVYDYVKRLCGIPATGL